MGIMDWLPLAVGGLAIYFATTKLAGFLLRGSREPILADHERPEPAPRSAKASSRGWFGGGSARSPFTPKESARSARGESARSAKPAAEPPASKFDGPKQKSVNRDVAAKIEKAAQEMPSVAAAGPLEITQPLEVVDPNSPESVRREAHTLIGKIESLDFTLDDKQALGEPTAIEMTSVDLPVAPLEFESGPTDAESIGATLLMDHEELLKAIRGKGPTPPSTLPPVADATGPTTNLAMAREAEPPAAGNDWTAALDGINDWQSPAQEHSFFTAPQTSRDMATTQLFRLHPPIDPNADPRKSPVAASTDEAVKYAAPDLVLPDFSLPNAPAAPAAAAKPAASKAVRTVAKKPTKKRDPDAIEHNEFRALAVAHDDIQSARVAFEELLEQDAGAADPIYRALVFGAIVAYARPFLGAEVHPLLAELSNPRFAVAHEELLDAQHRLIEVRDPSDDQVVRLHRGDGSDEGDGGSFAVRTDVLNASRMPVYVALCNYLEARLLDRLQALADEAIGAA
jgi:hypothetical protein